MQYRLYFLLSFVFAALTFPTLCLASDTPDRIILNNGDHLTGKILNRNAQTDTLTFRMQAGPVISLGKDIISTIKPATEQSAKPTPEETPPPVEGPKTASENKPKTGYKYSGRLEFGGEIQTGNSETQSLLFDARTQARDKKNRFIGNFEYQNSEEEGETTDDEWLLDFNYDRFVSHNWFVGALASFENDDVAELDLRTRLGINTGYQFYDRDDLSLSSRVGLEYINENFASQSTDTSMAFSWNSAYEQAFWKKRLRTFFEHDFLVPTDDVSGFIFEAETGLRVPVAEKFIGTAEVNLDWNNAPADGTTEEDITYIMKLGYEF